MLKKLQNLLFEDDDDDELEDEDEVEEVEEPVTTRPVHTAQEQPKPVAQPQPVEPVMKEEQSHMNRIDVTGYVPVQEVKPEQTAVQQSAPVKEEKKAKLVGITVDDFNDVQPAGKKVVQQTKPKTQKQVKTQTKKTPVKQVSKPSYQFQPVISPIFGVDEKDLTALKTTTQKVAEINSMNEDDSNITPVISPIYGSTSEGSVSSFEQPMKENVVKKEIPVTKQEEPKCAATVEDEIPEFSLDDILKVRDEEYDNSSDALGNTAPLFPDLDLQFPDDPEDAEDTVETPITSKK